MEIKNHRLTSAMYKATPNRGGSLTPEGIVLHDTAGRLDTEGSVAWLCNPRARASAHLVVGRNAGNIWQLAPFNVVTWHAGKSSYEGRRGVNAFAVGIEIVNPGKLDMNGRAWFGVTYEGAVHKATREHGSGWWLGYTEDQIAEVTDICVALADKYPSIRWITTHWHISPGRKVDTNPLFPLDHVRSRVFGRKEDEGFDARTTTALNIRRWPSINEGNLIDTLAKGTAVDFIRSGVFDGVRWYLVKAASDVASFPFGEGWVHGGYLQLE